MRSMVEGGRSLAQPPLHQPSAGPPPRSGEELGLLVTSTRTGKRVFKMAPIHHHFEQIGWSESTVVIRFWIISFVLALAGLSTLKLR